MLDAHLHPERPIRLRKVRGVADVLNATFQFLRQNYAAVGKSLLLIAGPPTVLASASGSIYQVFAFGLAGGALPGMGLGLSALMMFLMGVLSLTLTATVATGLVTLYLTDGPEGLAVRRVWTFTRSVFWRVLLALLLLGVVLVLGMLIVIVPCLGALGYLAGFFYFAVVFSVLVPMLLNERVGIFEALGRCRRLVRGYWWPTCGVLVVAVILYLLISLWTTIPYYTMLMLTTLHGIEGSAPGSLTSLGLVATSVVAGLCGTVLYSIPYTAAAVHYYNLVERKARVGLRERVEALAPAPAGPSPSASFAPEGGDG